MAELDAERKYWERKIEELEEWTKLKIQSLENKYKRTKTELDENYPKFIELGELTPIEIEMSRRKYEVEKSQYLANKLAEIDDSCKKEVAQFVSGFQEDLIQLESKRNLASRKFEQKKAEFENNRQEREGLV